jgi:hypothetical protein
VGKKPNRKYQMKPIFLVLTFALVAGCQRYGGGYAGSYGNADRETTTEVVTQRDPHGALLFVIAWTAKHGGGTTSQSDRNLFTTIHGHAIHPNLQKRAVYSFQPDGSLKELPLREEQVAALFQEMQKADFHTSHSKLWQDEIAPQLVRVEAPDGS